MLMMIKKKTFIDSTATDLAIRKVIVRRSKSEKISIQFFYEPKNKDKIVSSITVSTGWPIESLNSTSLQIKLFAFQLKTAFSLLKWKNLISEAFHRQISENLPNISDIPVHLVERRRIRDNHRFFHRDERGFTQIDLSDMQIDLSDMQIDSSDMRRVCIMYN